MPNFTDLGISKNGSPALAKFNGRPVAAGLSGILHLLLLRPVIFFFDGPVTIAGEKFQSFAVEDGNQPTRIFDISAALQHDRRDRNGRPVSDHPVFSFAQFAEYRFLILYWRAIISIARRQAVSAR